MLKAVSYNYIFNSNKKEEYLYNKLLITYVLITLKTTYLHIVSIYMHRTVLYEQYNNE